MRVYDIPELIITLVKAKYDNVKSSDKVDCECNNVLLLSSYCCSPAFYFRFLWILIVLEAFTYDFRSGCPWEVLNADDLAIVSESLEEVKKRLCLESEVCVYSNSKIKKVANKQSRTF